MMIEHCMRQTNQNHFYYGLWQYIVKKISARLDVRTCFTVYKIIAITMRYRAFNIYRIEVKYQPV